MNQSNLSLPTSSSKGFIRILMGLLIIGGVVAAFATKQGWMGSVPILLGIYYEVACMRNMQEHSTDASSLSIRRVMGQFTSPSVRE